MTANSLDWPTMALGVLDADFRVLGPPELLKKLHNWGGRFNRASTPPDRARDDHQPTIE